METVNKLPIANALAMTAFNTNIIGARDGAREKKENKTHWEYCRLRKIGLIFDWNGI